MTDPLSAAAERHRRRLLQLLHRVLPSAVPDGCTIEVHEAQPVPGM